MLPFWRRKKKEEKEEKVEKKEVIESLLEKACKKYGRPDLYEPLSWTLFVEPRGRELDKLLEEDNWINYSIAASVMLYEGNIEQAKKYFERSLELTDIPTRRSHFRVVIDNIDDVGKIAKYWWELEGKYR